MRQIDDVDMRALKTAFRALVQRVGGLDAAATVTRVRPSQIAAYYDPNQPQQLMPADIVADLERVAGEPLVTAQLARLAGHMLVPMMAGLGSEARAIAAVFQETGELGARWASAMEDGHLDDAEVGRVQTELADLHRAAGAAMALLAGRKGRI